VGNRFARALPVCALLVLLAGCGGGEESSTPAPGPADGTAALSGTVSTSFPNQAIGTTSATIPVVIQSVGSAPAVFGTVSVTGPYAIAANTCKGSIPSGSQCAIDFTFTPAAIGSAAGVATVKSNRPAGDYTISLSGTGFVPSGWIRGRFLPSAQFAARCEVPRTGIDPYTAQPFPDLQGSGVDERNWLRSWTNELYLWFDEVIDRDPGFTASTIAYFDLQKVPSKDLFHFASKTSDYQALSQSGISAGYGATFLLISSMPPREVVIAYTEPGSPAVAAGLMRGARILRIDGADMVNANDAASIDKLNAGLAPETIGEGHTFVVQDPGAVAPRTVALTSTSVTSIPVQAVRSVSTPTGRVGYLLFNDHIATSESALAIAIAVLKNDAVTDLVLDLRYNGGGRLAIASELAYMIAGPGPTAGKTFEALQFSSKYPGINPVTGEVSTPFLSVSPGYYSLPAGQALPTLNLPRVFVLTGPGTCSASESIINSLRGVDVQVIQIGSTTCGKPYGFYPEDNCGTTYFSIQFRGVNAKGFGDYPRGFSPANSSPLAGVSVPGCSVGDDFRHALGDPLESRFAAALNYRATGSCSGPPTGMAQPQAAAPEGTWVPPVADGVVMKTPWQQNRILTP
jgi:carboxyl-terminal processing protease